MQIRNLTRRFTGLAALDDVSLAIAPGEFVALLGPSGSGKTTLLRILAGLDYPDGGSVEHEGADFLAAPARRRKVGLVFQHYALFRHLSVRENIAFGLRVRPWRRRPRRHEIAERVRQLLRRVQLEEHGERYPAQLSGGQRQRVALARALAVEPSLLLLDEPFGALDAQVRVHLRRWLRELHDESRLTTIFVTHDQEEALELADRIAVMNKGRIEQVDTPEVLYHRPATTFVCEFIGKVNKVPLSGTGEALQLRRGPCPSRRGRTDTMRRWRSSGRSTSASRRTRRGRHGTHVYGTSISPVASLIWTCTSPPSIRHSKPISRARNSSRWACARA